MTKISLHILHEKQNRQYSNKDEYISTVYFNDERRPFYETMALYSDGTEIEYIRATTLHEARINHYRMICNRQEANNFGGLLETVIGL